MLERAGEREAPRSVRLPSLPEMQGMEAEELADILRRYGITDPLPIVLAESQAYAARMAGITPEYFKANRDAVLSQLQAQIDAQVDKRGMLALTRDVSRKYELYQAVDGDLTQKLAWVCEGDDNTCEACWARAGDEGTIGELTARGLDVCLGGGLCRCVCVPTD
jgi:hypothetical protein